MKVVKKQKTVAEVANIDLSKVVRNLKNEPMVYTVPNPSKNRTLTKEEEKAIDKVIGTLREEYRSAAGEFARKFFLEGFDKKETTLRVICETIVDSASKAGLLRTFSFTHSTSLAFKIANSDNNLTNDEIEILLKCAWQTNIDDLTLYQLQQSLDPDRAIVDPDVFLDELKKEQELREKGKGTI